MMKKHALTVILVGAIAALAATLAPPGGAAAQPQGQPTLVLSPSSGWCDEAVEVTGSGFPVTPVAAKTPEVYLVQPGTTDVSMGFLTSGNVNQDGSFSQWFSLSDHGCEAAALDSQAEQPAGYLTIVATPQHQPPGPGLQPGDHIPNIIAVAHYTYTTTTHQPPPVMVISPSSGPCDATVEVTGSGFEPGQQFKLRWAYPSSESSFGDLASVTADPEGAFLAELALGEIGCHAAQAYPSSGDPLPPRVRIDVVPVGPPVGVGGGLAEALYTLTTTAVGAGGAPRVLPSTGGGPMGGSGPASWVLLIGGVAASGVILVAGSLLWRRIRS